MWLNVTLPIIYIAPNNFYKYIVLYFMNQHNLLKAITPFKQYTYLPFPFILISNYDYKKNIRPHKALILKTFMVSWYTQHTFHPSTSSGTKYSYIIVQYFVIIISFLLFMLYIIRSIIKKNNFPNLNHIWYIIYTTIGMIKIKR